MNRALCFKSAWRIHHNPELLVSRIIKGKYRHSPLDYAKQGKRLNQVSWSMRSMTQSSKIMMRGVGKRLGNGKSIHTFKDIWLAHDVIELKDTATLREAQQNMRVSDLISRDSTWNHAKLQALMDDKTVKVIKGIYIPITDTEDADVWLHNNNGDYSVRSGYEFLNKPRFNYTRGMNWSLVWKACLPEKWKIFMWRACQNALPTADALAKRGCQVNEMCHMCGVEKETVQHLFRTCSLVDRVWKASSLGLNPRSNLATSTFNEWVNGMLFYFSKVHDKVQGARMTAEFVATMWTIWLARNEKIFKQAPISPITMVFDIKRHMMTWIGIYNHNTMQGSRNNTSNEYHQQNVCVIHRDRNEQNTAGHEGENIPILIVDGSWKSNNSTLEEGATGWVLMKEGVCLLQGARKVYANSPLQTEALAMYDGLKAVMPLTERVTIHTDSQILLNSFCKPHLTPYYIQSVVRDIENLIKSNFKLVSCCKVQRNSVDVAHKLARQANNL